MCVYRRYAPGNGEASSFRSLRPRDRGYILVAMTTRLKNIGDAGLKGAALKLSNVTDVVAFSHVRRLCSVYKIGPRVMVCQL